MNLTKSDNVLPFCSIVMVNFNGIKYLRAFFNSILALNYPKNMIEIIMVDNGSADKSIEFVNNNYPEVIVITNINNFSKALNIVVDKSKGDFIAFLNNDMEVDKRWLIELIEMVQKYPEAGCIGGKILFHDKKTINSVGHEKIGAYYFQDKGFQEKDLGQYDRLREVDGICGGAILWRRECLDNIGPFDEDYEMYFEDVDMAYRCKEKNWRMYYTPKSVAYHKFHGTSSDELCYFLCNRNRFLFLARHIPDYLPKSILTSHLYCNSQFEFLRQCIPITMLKLLEFHGLAKFKRIVPEIFNKLDGFLSAEDLLKTIYAFELMYKSNKSTICIYDHALIPWLRDIPALAGGRDLKRK